MNPNEHFVIIISCISLLLFICVLKSKFNENIFCVFLVNYLLAYKDTDPKEGITLAVGPNFYFKRPPIMPATH